MDIKEPYCLNCGHELKVHEKYCPVCGQQKKAYIFKIKELGNQFFVTLFNIDNTIFRTLRLLPTPWKLTRLFVAGQRIPYYHPARVFIVLLFFLFSLSLLKQEEPLNLELGTSFFYTQEDFKLRDSIEAFIRKNPDLKEREQEMLAHFFEKGKIPNDTFKFEPFLVIKDIPVITIREVLMTDLDDIFKKHNITGFWEKIYMEQFVKMYKNNQGFASFFLKNVLWALPFGILAGSMFLYLLYYRNGVYYMEHVILQFTIHAAIFSYFIFAIIFSRLIPSIEVYLIAGIGLVVVNILPPLSFYMYYGQNIFKTLIKYFLFIVLYLILIVIGVVFVLIFSAFLF